MNIYSTYNTYTANVVGVCDEVVSVGVRISRGCMVQ